MTDLPLERILQDWPGAHARVRAYLHAVGVAGAEIAGVASRAIERALGRKHESGAVADAIDETAHVLMERYPLRAEARPNGEGPFARWRLAAWQAGAVRADRPLEQKSMAPTPALLRGSMAPALYKGRRLGERRRSCRNVGRGRSALGHSRSVRFANSGGRPTHYRSDSASCEPISRHRRGPCES